MKNKKEKLAALQSILAHSKKASPVLSIKIEQAGEKKEEEEDVDLEQPATPKKR